MDWPVLEIAMGLYPQMGAAGSAAGQIRLVADADCTEVTCRSGKIAIEGVIFQAGRAEGPGALELMADMIDAEGPSALAKIEGDFVAVIAAGDMLHAYKSFTSQYQLYYREDVRRFSNRLADFYAPDETRWDEHYFARHVCLIPGYQFLSRDTPLADVRRVLPGELVSFTPALTRTQLVRRQYAYRLDASQTKEEVAPRILEILRRSVRQRLSASPSRKICVEISGGLDSSFIACLLGEQTSGIRGVMFTQPNLPSHAISESYARDVADRYGIDLAIVGPDELPQCVDADPGYSDEPSDFFWFGDMFSRSVADIAGENALVFTGYGADQLFLRSPSFLSWLLQRGEYRLFNAALSPASRLMSRGRANLARQSALTLIPERTHRALNGFFAGRIWNPFDVSDVSFQRVLGGNIPWVRCGRGAETYSLEKDDWERRLVGNGIICDDWGYFSAPRTVTQGHFAPGRLADASPFCDLPLMDFMYQDVSALLVHDFSGRYKELLRECQKGIVPETLRDRKNDTFVFNSFQLRYLNTRQDYFRSLIQSAPEEWVDRRAALMAFEQVLFGLTSSSTRSVVALLGYLRWRDAFVRHCADPASARSAGRILAQHIV